MKKLVTAACALVAASAFAVESANTVGYEVQSYEGPRTQSVRFQGVGSNGSAVNITNVLDGTLVADYSDTIEIYDGETGDFTAYMWDTETWFDALTDDPITISVVPGNAFIVTASEWRFAGEVAPDGYQHQIESGVPTLVGSAYPVATTLAHYDWSSIADYNDTLEIYDGETGDFTAYMWDTTQWFDALTDDPIAMTTRADDGFILTTGLDTITQHINVVAVQEGE